MCTKLLPHSCLNGLIRNIRQENIGRNTYLGQGLFKDSGILFSCLLGEPNSEYEQIFTISHEVIKVMPKRLYITARGGCSSAVERQLPKLNVRGSTPLTRSNHLNEPNAASVSHPWVRLKQRTLSKGICNRSCLRQISPSSLVQRNLGKQCEGQCIVGIHIY